MKFKRMMFFVIIVVLLAAIVLAGSLLLNRNNFQEEVATQVKSGKDISLINSKIYSMQKEDGLYLINRDFNDGAPLFGPAKEIYIEHQDTCARVKCQDGTWAIVDCYSGETLIQNCSKILELPLVTVTGAAVRDGNVVIFSLPTDDTFRITCEKPGYSDVERVILNDFVIVEKDGKYGVLYAYNGEEAIPPDYKYIKCMGNPNDDHKTSFMCKKTAVSVPKIYVLP